MLKKTEGFTNDKIFNFARLVFNNHGTMKKFSYFFDNQSINIPKVTSEPTIFKIYESTLLPMLRCLIFNKKFIFMCCLTHSQ